MNKIDIQQITTHEIEQLQRIARQTFYETFSEANTGENMEKYLDESFSIGKLTAELCNEHSKFYFAKLGDNVIGYLKLNMRQAQTELKNNDAVEIERIYVLQEYHGEKIGQALYEKAIGVATQLNAGYVWLGVWERNPRAINFYKKNGFVEFGRHIFRLGDDEQVDIMMKKNLTLPMHGEQKKYLK
ncbi:MAG: GNAT family N-acetyltransferase [Chitinophagaceae bacterium]|nr:GNAT family N-acetyltransferase [Chitinophagaceae bacterium]MCW5926726.1 GNAT family N-acetyltransferase [Chitinophagaceae bacterium]